MKHRAACSSDAELTRRYKLPYQGEPEGAQTLIVGRLACRQNQPMNILMAGLSAQLLVYSMTWLALGVGYRLKRHVALMWSAGWMMGTCATALLFFNTLELPVSRDLVINVLAVGGFLMIRHGVDAFAGAPTPLWEHALALGGLALVEVLRRQGGEATTAWRVCIFTAVASWPLIGIGWRMVRWKMALPRTSYLTIAILLAPLVLTIGSFVFRAVLVVTGTDVNTVNYDQGSNFDLLATLVFLLVLGAFNFSLANLVLGALVERLRTLSATDQLTGLANRRVMMRRLVEEHARFLRSGQVYSVVMMDLDHFKKVNDTHGHGVGDQVLKGLANLLQNSQRQTDTLARTGGEEFMLLMPMTDVDGATAHANRLCERVARAAMATDAGVQHITLSLGVAEAGLDDASGDIVVSRADSALYRAKDAGRNRVEFASRVVMPGWVL